VSEVVYVPLGPVADWFVRNAPAIAPRRVSAKTCTHPQRFIHKLPPCRVTLRGRKSRPGYPEDPRTSREHLRRARLGNC